MSTTALTLGAILNGSREKGPGIYLARSEKGESAALASLHCGSLPITVSYFLCQCLPVTVPASLPLTIPASICLCPSLYLPLTLRASHCLFLCFSVSACALVGFCVLFVSMLDLISQNQTILLLFASSQRTLQIFANDLISKSQTQSMHWLVLVGTCWYHSVLAGTGWSLCTGWYWLVLVGTGWY